MKITLTVDQCRERAREHKLKHEMYKELGGVLSAIATPEPRLARMKSRRLASLAFQMYPFLRWNHGREEKESIAHSKRF